MSCSRSSCLQDECNGLVSGSTSAACPRRFAAERSHLSNLGQCVFHNPGFCTAAEPCWHTQNQFRLACTCHLVCPAGTVLDNQELRDKLSTAEQKFTTEFFVAMGRHFKSSVLDELPPAYQSLVSALKHCPPVSGVRHVVLWVHLYASTNAGLSASGCCTAPLDAWVCLTSTTANMHAGTHVLFMPLALQFK